MKGVNIRFYRLLLLSMTYLLSLDSHALTFNVTSSNCSGSGSLVEAIESANLSPGTDTVSLSPNLQINMNSCPQVGSFGPDYYVTRITDSLVIEGNGGILDGHIAWVNASGVLNSTSFCPSSPDATGTVIVAETPGLFIIGNESTSNAGLSVTIEDLTIRQMHALAYIYDDAAFKMTRVKVEDIFAFLECDRSALYATSGVTLTLEENQWNDVYNWSQIGVFPVQNPAIACAGNCSDLNISDSNFEVIKDSGLIGWNGQSGLSQVNIVSTIMDDSGAVQIGGQAESNIVNSIWADDSFGIPDEEDYIVNLSTGEMNIEGSTLVLTLVDCDGVCQASGSPGRLVQWNGAGNINLRGSAFGQTIPAANGSGPLLSNFMKTASGGFTADTYTWMHTVPDQDASALRTLTGQPLLLVDEPGLPIANAVTPVQRATPVLGTIGTPGQLVDAIPDGCGSNQLINPITGQPITTDVVGNARCDTGNGGRNIGAIQHQLSPHLSVFATGSGQIDLAWSRPEDPGTGPLTGYDACYGTGTVPDPIGLGTSCPGTFVADLSVDPDTLTGSLIGLNNGVVYWALVRGRNTTSDSPWSNVVSATPYGQIPSPSVSAIMGDGIADLSWTLDNTSGHSIDEYVVSFRPIDQPFGYQFVFTTASSIQISGLVNGTTYIFEVYARSSDNSTGTIGQATGTPFVSSNIYSQSGGGSISIGALLLFVLLMLKRCPRSFLAFLTLVVAFQPLNASSEESSDQISAWSFTVGMGQSSFAESDRQIRQQIESGLSGQVNQVKIDDRDTALLLRLDYELSPQWRAEGVLLDLSDPSVDAQVQSGSASITTERLAELTPGGAHGVAVGGSFQWQAYQKINLQGRLGAFAWRSKISSYDRNSGQTGHDSRNGVDALLGLGMHYQFNPQVFVGLEYLKAELENPIEAAMITLNFKTNR